MQFEEEVSISMPGNGGIANGWSNMLIRTFTSNLRQILHFIRVSEELSILSMQLQVKLKDNHLK